MPASGWFGLVATARAVGMHKLQLQTFSALREAAHLYRSVDFTVVWERTRDDWGPTTTYQRAEAQVDSAGVASRRFSAGILMYRRGEAGREVLLVHPGGPMWARRDAGVWSIPKGECEADEAPEAAARREFAEELGVAPPDGPARDLGEITQRAGKVVRAFALEGDLDTDAVVSNATEIQWPPHSGRTIEIPEIDRAEWFNLTHAAEKLIPGQVPLLDRLTQVPE